MRIVAGVYGGRHLVVPKGRDIRPTSDKVRGAIFNMLESRGTVAGARVIDGFCGTGALGLEALSRGAAHCLFIDKVRESVKLARENAALLGVEAAEFLLRDLTKIGFIASGKEAADLVFLDPPYGQDFAALSLKNLYAGGWIKPGAWCVIETEKKARVETPHEIVDERVYGDTKVTTLRVEKI